jgi:hypothetical protein
LLKDWYLPFSFTSSHQVAPEEAEVAVHGVASVVAVGAAMAAAQALLAPLTTTPSVSDTDFTDDDGPCENYDENLSSLFKSPIPT